MQKEATVPQTQSPVVTHPVYIEELTMADKLRDRGHYREAIEEYRVVASRSITRQPYANAYALQQMGVCSARLNDHDSALDQYSLAIWITMEYVFANSVHLRACILRDKADTYIAIGEFDNAFTDLESSTRIFEKFGSSDQLVSNLHFNARLYRAQKDFVEEGKHLYRAFELTEKGYAKDARLYIYLDYASWLIRHKDLTQAHRISARALKLAWKIRSRRHVARALMLLFGANWPDRIEPALYGHK